MISLSLYDLVCLVSSLVIFSLPLLWPSIPSSLLFTHSVPYLLPIAHVGMTGMGSTTQLAQNIPPFHVPSTPPWLSLQNATSPSAILSSRCPTTGLPGDTSFLSWYSHWLTTCLSLGSCRWSRLMVSMVQLQVVKTYGKYDTVAGGQDFW